PAGTTFVSATLVGVTSGSCVLNGRMVICNAGDVPTGPGIGLHIVVTDTAPSGTVLTDTVSVESTNLDPNPANNTATLQTVVQERRGCSGVQRAAVRAWVQS